MKKGDFRGKKGFTFVEVSLVLAIAGLIFLMVFIALPAVQRVQKDSERQEDISNLLSAIKKYQTNNRGALPDGGTSSDGVTYSGSGAWNSFYKEYLGADFTDPTGTNYKLVVYSQCTVDAGSNVCNGTKGVENKSFPDGYKIYLVKGAGCDGSTVIKAENPRKVAATYKLEGAGAFCNHT